jgi:hypothetical protein
MIRWACALLSMATLAAAGCGLVGSSPHKAAQISYVATYTDPGTTGMAHVTYTATDGHALVARVNLPWESESIDVEDGASYRVDVSAPPAQYLECGIRTDNGWSATRTSADGSCTYTYPDDIGN